GGGALEFQRQRTLPIQPETIAVAQVVLGIEMEHVHVAAQQAGLPDDADVVISGGLAIESVDGGDIAETAIARGHHHHPVLGPELGPADALALLLVTGTIGGDDPLDHLAILHAMDDAKDLRAIAEILPEHTVVV